MWWEVLRGKDREYVDREAKRRHRVVVVDGRGLTGMEVWRRYRYYQLTGTCGRDVRV